MGFGQRLTANFFSLFLQIFFVRFESMSSSRLSCLVYCDLYFWTYLFFLSSFQLLFINFLLPLLPLTLQNQNRWIYKTLSKIPLICNLNFTLVSSIFPLVCHTSFSSLLPWLYSGWFYVALACSLHTLAIHYLNYDLCILKLRVYPNCSLIRCFRHLCRVIWLQTPIIF